jgi:BMFP domain-containing protein YqiC
MLLREIQSNRQILLEVKEENTSLKALVRDLEKKIDSLPPPPRSVSSSDRVFSKRDETTLKHAFTEALVPYSAVVQKGLEDMRNSLGEVRESVHKDVKTIIEDKNRLTFEEHKQRQMEIITLNQQMFATGQRFHADISGKHQHFHNLH